MPKNELMSWVSRLFPALSEIRMDVLVVSTTWVGPTASLVSGGMQPQFVSKKDMPSNVVPRVTPGGVNTAPTAPPAAGNGWAATCELLGSLSKVASLVTVRP